MKIRFLGLGGTGVRNGPFVGDPLSFLHFSCFLMFSIFCFSLKKGFFFFPFSCISFKYVSLLALVSEFN